MSESLSAKKNRFVEMAQQQPHDPLPALVVASLCANLDQPDEARRWRQIALGRADRAYMKRLIPLSAVSILLGIILYLSSVVGAGLAVAIGFIGPFAWNLLRVANHRRLESKAADLRRNLL